MMDVNFISGINADYIKVSISGDFGYFEKNYYYGYNASYSRKWADKKCPYIGDIFQDLIETYNVKNGEVKFTGYYVFSERDMKEEEVQKLVDKIMEEM